jgi:hypothetical protein
MKASTQMPPQMFHLEGTFLGFLGNDAQNPTFLVLEVEQEPITIKLPRTLQPSIPRSAVVGDRLQCIGRSQIDYKAGLIKLRAYQILFLPPSEGRPAPAPRFATPEPVCL